MSTTPELLPCPFCGCEKINVCQKENYHGHLINYAQCDDCEVEILAYAEDVTLDEIIEMWNTRAEVYIAHPITGERMDKSQCKRVITQMYARISELKAIAEKDNPKPLKDRGCPTCGNGFLSAYGVRDECCSTCGQRLDWNEE